jgi:hypothetical protein
VNVRRKAPQLLQPSWNDIIVYTTVLEIYLMEDLPNDSPTCELVVSLGRSLTHQSFFPPE